MSKLLLTTTPLCSYVSSLSFFLVYINVKRVMRKNQKLITGSSKSRVKLFLFTNDD